MSKPGKPGSFSRASSTRGSFDGSRPALSRNQSFSALSNSPTRGSFDGSRNAHSRSPSISALSFSLMNGSFDGSTSVCLSSDQLNVHQLSIDETEMELKLISSARVQRRQHIGPDPQQIQGESIRRSLQINGRAPTIVTDSIVIGSRDDVQNCALLQDLGITHVLNVAIQLPNYHPSSFIYHKVDLKGIFHTYIDRLYHLLNCFSLLYLYYPS